jgi:hypothetical protein
MSTVSLARKQQLVVRLGQLFHAKARANGAGNVRQSTWEEEGWRVAILRKP